jgi:hypothetical protein
MSKVSSLAEWLSALSLFTASSLSVYRDTVWLQNESDSKNELVTFSLQANLETVPLRARSLQSSDRNGSDPGTSKDT